MSRQPESMAPDPCSRQPRTGSGWQRTACPQWTGASRSPPVSLSTAPAVVPVLWYGAIRFASRADAKSVRSGTDETLQRQCHSECRAGTTRGLDLDRATVRGHEVPGDGQPQAGATGTLALDEPVEHVGQKRGVDARAGVRNAEYEPIARYLAADCDRAPRRSVPDPVRHEVGQHLADADRVDVDDRQIGRDIGYHGHAGRA